MRDGIEIKPIQDEGGLRSGDCRDRPPLASRSRSDRWSISTLDRRHAEAARRFEAVLVLRRGEPPAAGKRSRGVGDLGLFEAVRFAVAAPCAESCARSGGRSRPEDRGDCDAHVRKGRERDRCVEANALDRAISRARRIAEDFDTPRARIEDPIFRNAGRGIERRLDLAIFSLSHEIWAYGSRT